MSGQASITKFFRPVSSSASSALKSGAINLSGDIKDENCSPNKSKTNSVIKSDINNANKSNVNCADLKMATKSNKRKLEEKIKTEDSTLAKNCPVPEEKNQKDIKAKITLLCSQLGGALHSNIGQTWFEALEKEFCQEYFLNLSKFVDGERKSNPNKIFPPAEEVWSWTHHFDIQDTKVVILGQDPYHGPKQAHGLCFSVLKGLAAPPSLVNMYKELNTDIEGFQTPNHGFLEGWAKQGVLLLNACLTVREGQANSHKNKGWERLTDAVIKHISDNTTGAVFFLWGAHAQKKASMVNSKKHHLLNTVHPSPLSAYRGFFGCKHFSKCNEILAKEGKTPIDWTNLY